MEKRSLVDELSSTSYPGRGIIVGRSADGKRAVCAYFIMGRSANSRNRIFVMDGDGIRTKAYDESAMEDPSLIIYAPVRVHGCDTIVTNGDQTDTIFEGLEKGIGFSDSLKSREFEPDAPNYTPRISALMHVENGEYSYEMSILKSADGDPSSCQRQSFSFTPALAGQAHYIHTYKGDGDPLPSFEGEPTLLEMMDDDIDSFAAGVWNCLDEANKVSLFVRYIDIETGESDSRLVNKNSPVRKAD